MAFQTRPEHATEAAGSTRVGPDESDAGLPGGGDDVAPGAEAGAARYDLDGEVVNDASLAQWQLLPPRAAANEALEAAKAADEAIPSEQ